MLIAFSERDEGVLRVFGWLMKSQASFVTSNLLELETVPSTVYVGKREAHDPLLSFFGQWRPRLASASTVQIAAAECSKLPLGSMDVLHLAAAHQAGVTMFLTMEKVTKPTHRCRLVPGVHFDRVA
ncbi:MAG TPA: hypothetical protein PKA64_03695 [Myxococcota bacterium]|nr:hypothetical protein [Myxococcota bacterium]